MQQYRDESEIYNYQRIRLWNIKFINDILGGTLHLAWLQIQSMSIALYKAYNFDTIVAIHILSICNILLNYKVLYVCFIYIHIKVLYVKAGFRSGLAQSVEHLTAEWEVAGSIPGAGPILRVLK